MALTFKSCEHAAAIYPNGNIKWIAIPAGGATFDKIIEEEYNDGMLIFAISDKDQRIAIIAPENPCTKEQHDTLMEQIGDWLDRLQVTNYKSAYKKASCTKLDFGGLIVQPAQKTALKDEHVAATEADAVKKLVSEWIMATTFKQPKPTGGDGGDKPSGDDGKGGKPTGGDGGDKPTGGDKPAGGDKPKGRTQEENFALGRDLFNKAFAALKK